MREERECRVRAKKPGLARRAQKAGRGSEGCYQLLVQVSSCVKKRGKRWRSVQVVGSGRADTFVAPAVLFELPLLDFSTSTAGSTAQAREVLLHAHQPAQPAPEPRPTRRGRHPLASLDLAVQTLRQAFLLRLSASTSLLHPEPTSQAVLHDFAYPGVSSRPSLRAGSHLPLPGCFCWRT